MKLLLSGEGPTDLGVCTNAQGRCDGNEWQPGPMAVLVTRLMEAEAWLGYDLLTTPESIHSISETALCEATKALPMRLKPARSKKQEAETGYFFSNAMTLAREAIALAERSEDVVMAVFFRDSDGTAKAKASEWDAKWQSITDGFKRAEFSLGVAMLPRPKSEAWLIAMSSPGLQNCSDLENLPGNDASPKSAKSTLAALMPAQQSAQDWCDWMQAVAFDANHLKRLNTMTSFKKFHDELERVTKQVRAGASA